MKITGFVGPAPYPGDYVNWRLGQCDFQFLPFVHDPAASIKSEVISGAVYRQGCWYDLASEESGRAAWGHALDASQFQCFQGQLPGLNRYLNLLIRACHLLCQAAPAFRRSEEAFEIFRLVNWGET